LYVTVDIKDCIAWQSQFLALLTVCIWRWVHKKCQSAKLLL